MRMRRFLAALVVIACLLLAQLHVWADFDPCLLNPASAQQHRGTNHGSGHGCQSCLASYWAMVTAAPGLAVSLVALRLETQMPHFAGQDFFTCVSSPRAPPR